MKPIATYNELTKTKRRFELYEDQIKIYSKQRFKPQKDRNIKLVNLDKDRNTMTFTRECSFTDPSIDNFLAINLFISVGITALLLVLKQMNIWFIPMLSPIIHLIWIKASWKDFEVVGYNLSVGPNAFTIGQFGTPKDELDHFLNLIEKQIEIQHKKQPNHESEPTRTTPADEDNL
jgi:hypothetical protein